MGDAFRRFFLSIGVALGLAAGQPDPVLYANIVNAQAEGPRAVLRVDARIENAFEAGAIELIETGTRIALRYRVRLEGPQGSIAEAQETRSIWYDMRTGFYRVSFAEGKAASLVDPQAARLLAAELSGLELKVVPGAESAVSVGPSTVVVVSAEIGILDQGGSWHDAPVLWNYSSPRAQTSAASALRAEGSGGR
jgi:hypothetical protein